MSTFDDIRKEIAKAKEEYIRQYATALADEGKKLIDKAFETATFNKHKTQNLHDSYGSCVFFNGKEMQGTRRYVGRKAVQPRYRPTGEAVWGREEIDKFFDSYRAKKDGWELVTAAAIFYAEELEKGIGLRRKYRVISGLGSEMNALAKRTGGRVVNINM